MAKGRKTGGRTTRCTDATTELVCRALVHDRISLKAAAALAGVHDSNLRRWREQGEEDLAEGRDTVFARFAFAVSVALAELERYCVQMLCRSRAWRRWEAILARRFPRDWGSQLKLQGDDDNPVHVAIRGKADVATMLEDQDIRRLAELVISRARGGAPESAELGDPIDAGELPDPEAP